MLQEYVNSLHASLRPAIAARARVAETRRERGHDLAAFGGFLGDALEELSSVDDAVTGEPFASVSERGDVHAGLYAVTAEFPLECRLTAAIDEDGRFAIYFKPVPPQLDHAYDGLDVTEDGASGRFTYPHAGGAGRGEVSFEDLLSGFVSAVVATIVESSGLHEVGDAQGARD